MKPVQFPEQTCKLVAAPGDEEVVGDLPVYRDGNYCVSKWRMTWRERLRVLVTGTIWFWACGKTHPPIYLGVERPEVLPSRGMNPIRRVIVQHQVKQATKEAIRREMQNETGEDYGSKLDWGHEQSNERGRPPLNHGGNV